MDFEWKVEQRASAILLNILKSLDCKTTFLLPANVCPIVPAIFFKAKVKFRFIDISLKTLCIDLEQVKHEIVQIKNPGLLYVRNLGILHDTNATFAELKKSNSSLIIIDDRCLSKITILENDLCSEADATLFSTGYGKYIDLGWGGLAAINVNKIEYKSLQLDFHPGDLLELTSGFSKSLLTQNKFHYRDSAWLNTNKPATGLAEYISIIQLCNKEMKIHKDRINSIYRKNIPGSFIPSYDFDLDNWRFTVFCPNKNTILKKIFDKGYFASSHYASLAHLFGGKRESNAETLAARTLNLFNNFKVTEAMALNISQIFKL